MIDPSAYTSSYGSDARARIFGHVPVFNDKNGKTTAAARNADPAVIPADSAATGAKSHGFLGFLKDIFDIINPLQHIPVVGAIYRQVTGDIPGPVARIAGDALYGGPIGAVIGIADTALKESSGKDMGETVFAMLKGPGKDAPVQVASALPASSGIAWDPPGIVWNDTTQTVPRAQVAARMMEALDKYKALKIAQEKPTLSAVF